MPERRGYKRFAAQGRAILKLTDGTSRSIDAEVLDLSFLGVCVQAQEKIEEGIEVDFELKFLFWPRVMFGKGKVKTALEIAREDAKVFRMGIDFLDVDKGSLGCVLGCIESRIRFEEKNKKKTRGKQKF